MTLRVQKSHFIYPGSEGLHAVYDAKVRGFGNKTNLLGRSEEGPHRDTHTKLLLGHLGWKAVRASFGGAKIILLRIGSTSISVRNY